MDELDVIADMGDWLDKEETRLYDLMDRLEEGKTTFIAARFAIHMEFVDARKDLADQRDRLEGVVTTAGFRIVLPLPDVIA